MIVSYKFFMTPMCPDCAEIKDYLKTIEFPGEIIDAATDEGLSIAQNLSIMGVPTMVFFDKTGKETNRADNLDEIRKILDNKSLLDV